MVSTQRINTTYPNILCKTSNRLVRSNTPIAFKGDYYSELPESFLPDYPYQYLGLGGFKYENKKIKNVPYGWKIDFNYSVDKHIITNATGITGLNPDRTYDYLHKPENRGMLLPIQTFGSHSSYGFPVRREQGFLYIDEQGGFEIVYKITDEQKEVITSPKNISKNAAVILGSPYEFKDYIDKIHKNINDIDNILKYFQEDLTGRQQQKYYSMVFHSLINNNEIETAKKLFPELYTYYLETQEAKENMDEN